MPEGKESTRCFKKIALRKLRFFINFVRFLLSQAPGCHGWFSDCGQITADCKFVMFGRNFLQTRDWLKYFLKHTHIFSPCRWFGASMAAAICQGPSNILLKGHITRKQRSRIAISFNKSEKHSTDQKVSYYLKKKEKMV